LKEADAKVRRPEIEGGTLEHYHKCSSYPDFPVSTAAPNI
jgi:hypothetical protein